MSDERWILAIDLGNGGPKVAVVSLDGEVRRTAARAVSVHVGLDGAATQDADEWWSGLLAACAEVVDRSGAGGDSLHAVGITGQWGSTVPVGADGTPVGEVLLWADTRARELVRAGARQGGQISLAQGLQAIEVQVADQQKGEVCRVGKALAIKR